jgi:hypothetical protein
MEYGTDDAPTRCAHVRRLLAAKILPAEQVSAMIVDDCVSDRVWERVPAFR